MKGLSRYAAFVLAMVVSCASLAAAPEEGKPGTPAAQYQSLVKEFSEGAQVIWKDTTDEERKLAVARVEKLPLKLLELAKNNPKDAIAVDALTHVVTVEYWLDNYTSHAGWGKDSPQAKAIVLMLRDHLDSEKLADASKRVRFGFRSECETFLSTLIEKSPHREVQALACLRLAQFLLSRLERLDLIEDQPELARRYEVLYGKDYLEALRREDRAKVVKRAETLYERASKQYSEVKFPDTGTTVGETAKRELFEVRYLSVGKEAPAMEGVDQNGEQFQLSQYAGKVVLLYFWSEF